MTDTAGDRDGILDAAKLLLIVLVVVGHALEPLLGGRAVAAGYLFLSAFHVPLLVLIFGHFSKNVTVDERRAAGLLTRVVLPYLLFQTAYSLVEPLTAGRLPRVSLLSPYWFLWLLFALALWRMSMPYLARLRWPLIVAVTVSVLAGFTTSGGNAGVYRALGLLPFFVVGYLLPTGFHRELRDPLIRAIGVAAFAGTAAAGWLLAPTLDVAWVQWSGGYAALDVHGVIGPLIRLGLLLAGLLLGLSFLAWVPDLAVLATLGRRYMYPFLLHGFVLLLARHLGWYDRVGSWPAVLLVPASAAVLTVLLSAGVVQRVFRPFVEPSGAWLLARRGRYHRDVVQVADRQ